MTLSSRTLLLALLLSAPTAGRATPLKEATPLDYPHLEIASDAVRLVLLLPDAERGYYRGTRFDWSGLIWSCRWEGHEFFGPWQAEHDPLAHDAVCGPAEEFGMGNAELPPPVGYAEAAVGQPFLKLGVGLLEKPQEHSYRFFGPYKLLQPGTWEVTSGRDWAEFRQEMACPGGWAYRYTKRVEVLADPPGFALRHTLRNTGTRPLEQAVYAHNFFLLDGTPVGPDWRLRLPFPAQAPRDLGDKARLAGQTLFFRRPLVEGDPLFTELTGFAPRVEDSGFTLMNLRTGVEVTASVDRPPAAFGLYATSVAVCPEPFVRLSVAPGVEVAWSNQYTFSAVPARSE